jgi:hypothetical protein
MSDNASPHAVALDLKSFGTILFGNDNCQQTEAQKQMFGASLEGNVHFIAVRRTDRWLRRRAVRIAPDAIASCLCVISVTVTRNLGRFVAVLA